MSRVSLYYIEKKEGIIEGPLNYRKLKKFAPDYFNDCVNLMDKIRAKEYKDREIIQIVKYYNTRCK